MISELKQGQKISDNFLIKTIDTRKTKNGKDYFDINLSDKTGDINGKLWDASTKLNDGYKSGDFVFISGDVETFNGRLQLRINSMDKVKLTMEEKAKLIPCSDKDPNVMFQEIVNIIENMKNPEIKKVAKIYLDENKENFLTFPAAKSFHHAIIGGLILHTYTMLQVAISLSKIYTYINKDLLFLGVIIHDICKTSEMKTNEIGLVEDYTFEGELLGHIIQGVCEIDAICKRENIDKELSVLIKHMVLSHHYHPEFGSPKYPLIPEAELLHHIDLIDARMNQMENLMLNTKENEFSQRLYLLDNRRIYNHNLNKEEQGEY